MTILRCELPDGVRRQWEMKMSLATIYLCGREGTMYSQVRRIETMGWKFGATEDTHILQPPATLDQPGWRKVTTRFSLPGTMTTEAEGGILPGPGHCLVIPIRESFILCVENTETKRVGAVRVRKESLSRGENDCCGPESVVQSLLSSLQVLNGKMSKACIIGTGRAYEYADICEHLNRRGVVHANIEREHVCPTVELGVSNNIGRPEQDWVFICQHR